MPESMNASDPDFELRFSEWLNSRKELNRGVELAVRQIVADVRSRGDAAVIQYTREFDRPCSPADSFTCSPDLIDEKIANIPDREREAIDFAADRIRMFHLKQLPGDVQWTDSTGVELGWRWMPLDSVGIYVPGGLASYPSSVLMNAIPAIIAGVGEIVLTTPAPDGQFHPLVLYAARKCGIDKIYSVGGAQAIAALAYGTKSIRRVDKIAGPGNAYVAEAKRQVFGDVGIDMVAGPSEVMIIADKYNNPEWVAADLLAQAEHDEAAQAMLATDDAEFANRVAARVQEQLPKLPRRSIATRSWEKFGAIFCVNGVNDAANLSNRIAPEHLQICVRNDESLLRKVRHAGSIFLGPWTPEVIGDYTGGTNHVLPTSGSARFFSGLSVFDFLKRTTITRLSKASFQAVGPYAETLAITEGLHAHGFSIRKRLLDCGRADD